MSGALSRSRPCAFCPYRRDVPSGVWAPEEYDKLRAYDGDIGEQAAAGAFAAFYCHSSPECLCAGWTGHRDPYELLAVRFGISNGTVDPSVADCEIDAELFGSGADAADHGQRGVDAPDDRARAAIDKLTRADPTRLR